ncbi:2-amino-4-hydroxy-6-hydroxymethyldihydropteridine diphosphokinase [Terribacillus saccharophilus]|uniref:2-amino-4-hydroxy-6-hydroxymethyldihydropteridine diphosphokinase n=1 Tax=Terribacillus saccharophilus TaxID=361277 RepID=A0ABX4GTE8_9BACI|nr:2-amino-4-hydroxy-6-hydroxymethyldihydropteridine diphosphokinase [Terribacillus saccharophilus]PAD33658.1 2-amino-4-hydroxy-6-hydroxymethyldihydropteridine diphosphokinase [Terribacillus saccharophilus]PAD94421.1 2-amino-4-hydroxy-6-hydroxymethyldihydropteridine diphosphokinase [Terribacillus saccharophilus]PAD98144.1 2-amino-4-hydroxy-6-hydroxymethyldihydropteridine diphosphokinase [Terribacillus saccharophilus]
MKQAWIALGSNIAPREIYLQQAIQTLNEHAEIKLNQVSTVYETDPVGYEDQDQFLNLVAEVETSLKPMELLHVCQKIEQDLGRKRIIRWGPRTVDLDILLYSTENMNVEELTLPHPRMHERAFVLVPLAEIAPELFLKGKKVQEWLDTLAAQDVQGVRSWGSLNI